MLISFLVQFHLQLVVKHKRKMFLSPKGGVFATWGCETLKRVDVKG